MPDGYGVLYGDVVGSASIGRRAVFGLKLEEACRVVNLRFKKSIYAALKTIKGIDEVGAVLKSPAAAYSIADFMNEFLYPDQLRFVLVFGRIDRAFASRDAARMDGPAFHQVAKMLTALKRGRLLFALDTGHGQLDAAIAGEISLLLMLKGTWSLHQRRVAGLYDEGITQKDVAKRLKVTQQAVSGTLSRASWQAIWNIERQVNEALAQLSSLSGPKEVSDVSKPDSD
jgi:hypothetical protein